MQCVVGQVILSAESGALIMRGGLLSLKRLPKQLSGRDSIRLSGIYFAGQVQ
jgi:hypothetical protein